MELSGRRYPIGIQNFEQLRTRNCVYVDKTELVYKLVNTDQIYFFSRPRRFGKSLLVSTLEAYFQGKKELFEGLAMERLEQEWEVCPVLHVDFSLTKYTELRDLTGQLNLFLSRWEEIYGKKEEEEGAAERLQGIILRAYAKTGKPVVVLIDEYDAPLLDSNSDATTASQRDAQVLQSSQGAGAISPFSFYHGYQQVQPAEHLQRTEQFAKYQYAR